MSIIFQGNDVSLLSDVYESLVIQDQILNGNGKPSNVSGVVNSVIVMDKDKNTWIFTVPTWEHVSLPQGQYIHLEGPKEYKENGATFVRLVVCNSGGEEAFLIRQISSKALIPRTRLIGEKQEKR